MKLKYRDKIQLQDLKVKEILLVKKVADRSSISEAS